MTTKPMESMWARVEELLPLGRPRVAVGLASIDEEVLSGLEECRSYADILMVGPSHIAGVKGFETETSDAPERLLARLLAEGAVNGIVRGTVDDRTTLRAYSELTGENDTTCPTLFEDALGRQFFICPSSNPDGWTKEARFVESAKVANFVRQWGIEPRIAVYTAIRPETFAATQEWDEDPYPMLRKTAHDADWIVSHLAGLGLGAQNLLIELNRGIEDGYNIHVPVNGMVGNQMGRIVMACGGRMLTATRIGLSRPYEDNSRSEKDLSRHMRWLVALINLRTGRA